MMPSYCCAGKGIVELGKASYGPLNEIRSGANLKLTHSVVECAAPRARLSVGERPGVSVSAAPPLIPPGFLLGINTPFSLYQT